MNFKNLLLSSLFLLGMMATAQDLLPKDDDWTIVPHLHWRLRYDVQSDEAKDPTGHKMSGGKHKYGPHPSQYFDSRTKAWINGASKSLGMDFRIMLANRSMYYLTDWEEKNNYGTTHFSAPDSLYFYELYANFTKLGIEGLSIKLGRQTITLGNGLIIRDGVSSLWPTYFNGAVMTYVEGSNTLKAIALYDYWRDPFAVNLRWDREDYPNGRGRAVNPGNITTLALYDTYELAKPFNFDVYYVYNHVVADRNGRRDKKLPNDWDDLCMHTVGTRLFGDITPVWGYSAEFAQQLGQWEKNDNESPMQGRMCDLRLAWKIGRAFESDWAKSTNPVWSFSYTNWTGDKNGTDRYEGWYSLQSYFNGLFGDELSNRGGVPCGSMWTNLQAFHTDLKFKPLSKLTVTGGSTYFRANEFADGRNVGVVIYGVTNYQITKRLSVKTILSHMFYGDYYGSNRNDGGFWGRVELNYYW